MARLKKYNFPIPPIERQKQIVSILDKFEKLTIDISIGLPAEIEARRKQYEYYRNKLLTFCKSPVWRILTKTRYTGKMKPCEFIIQILIT